MLKNIFTKLGYITEAQHEIAVASLKNKVSQLEGENLTLRAEVTSYKNSEPEKPKTLIDIRLGDPIPLDSEARKMYVAQVAGFFKDIMKPKLDFMLSNLHNMLEERDSDRDFDLILKGVAYAFRDLIKWGDVMTNEQVANQNPSESSEEDVQSLKDKLENSN